MRTINSNSGRKWKNIFRSIDDIFIVIGILLNGFSLIYSFLYGHIIAGIVLVVCEIALASIYRLRMI
jgi:predicted membrane channel-forming protein YqfA (hemolysin III family)